TISAPVISWFAICLFLIHDWLSSKKPMKKKRPAQYRASSATPVGMAATLEPSRSTAVRQQKSPNKWKEIRFQTFQILRRRAICFAHLISHPRHLPFCVAARQHLDPRPGDIRIKRSRKHGHQLGNAERFHRRKRGIEAACRERPHLLERAALLQHPVETGLDAGVEPGAIGEKREMQIGRAAWRERAQQTADAGAERIAR